MLNVSTAREPGRAYRVSRIAFVVSIPCQVSSPHEFAIYAVYRVYTQMHAWERSIDFFSFKFFLASLPVSMGNKSSTRDGVWDVNPVIVECSSDLASDNLPIRNAKKSE